MRLLLSAVHSVSARTASSAFRSPVFMPFLMLLSPLYLLLLYHTLSPSVFQASDSCQSFISICLGPRWKMVIFSAFIVEKKSPLCLGIFLCISERGYFSSSRDRFLDRNFLYLCCHLVSSSLLTDTNQNFIITGICIAPTLYAAFYILSIYIRPCPKGAYTLMFLFYLNTYSISQK